MSRTLDLDEATANLGRLVDLLAGASACGKTLPETACNLVLEARGLAAHARDQLEGALALEHDARRREHAQNVMSAAKHLGAVGR